MGEGISEFSFESIPMPDCTLPHLTAADSLAVTEHVLLCILKVFLSLSLHCRGILCEKKHGSHSSGFFLLALISINYDILIG